MLVLRNSELCKVLPLRSLCQYYTQICSQGSSSRKTDFSHTWLSHYVPQKCESDIFHTF